MTESTFTAAAEQYLDMVYRVALNWFRNPADAEDAAQTAMLKLWQADTEFTNQEHLRRWLVRVTLNVCKDMASGGASGAVLFRRGAPGAVPGGHGPAGEVPGAPVPLLLRGVLRGGDRGAAAPERLHRADPPGPGQGEAET